MPNSLATESSPYLLQHQNNPVDWYPWGEEAIERARREKKPIFLSIGYSACHWCHVMEHESFENEAIAKYLNEHFVCIKVDREERPDLDQIYMNAVQLLTGHGGWPMSVFLTEDLKPFYGGTYWPPSASRGMPGFDQVLHAVVDAWDNRRDQISEGADQITAQVRSLSDVGDDAGDEELLTPELLSRAGRHLAQSFDPTYGGFGQAPKFPHAMDIQVLLRLWQRTGQEQWLDMVRTTLDKMAAGGIYDHLGGGFARYSVDARWLVPHFEKMLYDNALLTNVYLEAFLATGEKRYEQVVRETLDYTLRDMTDPAGGFYSTEDADSEGHEGLFYVWTVQEIKEILGHESEVFCRAYDVTESGNFEGRNILNLKKSISQSAKLLKIEEGQLSRQLAENRQKLFEVREKRIHPGKDDKVLVSWNGLMIDAMARAGAALGEPKYVQAAQAAADFILASVSERKELLHTWRRGTAKLQAYLDDYACFMNALVSLYEATFAERYLDAAATLADTLLAKFADPSGAGFFYTASDHETLITRNKEFTDSSTPSGNAVATTVLLRLGKLLGKREYLDAAYGTLKTVGPLLHRAPMASGQFLIALDMQLGPTPELVVFADKEQDQIVADIHGRFLPRRVIAVRGAEAPANRSSLLDAALTGKKSIDGKPTLYVCENQACQQPVVGLEAIRKEIEELTTVSR